MESVQTLHGHKSPSDFRMYVRARLLSGTHLSCTGLWFAFIVSILHLASVLVVRLAWLFGFQEASEEASEVRVDRSKVATLISLLLPLRGRRGATTAVSYDQARRDARKARRLFSYRLQDNDRYMDVCRALNIEIDPRALEVEGATSVFHQLASLMPRDAEDFTQEADDWMENANKTVAHVSQRLRDAVAYGSPYGSSNSVAGQAADPIPVQNQEGTQQPGRSMGGVTDTGALTQGAVGAQGPSFGSGVLSQEDGTAAVSIVPSVHTDDDQYGFVTRGDVPRPGQDGMQAANDALELPVPAEERYPQAPPAMPRGVPKRLATH